MWHRVDLQSVSAEQVAPFSLPVVADEVDELDADVDVDVDVAVAVEVELRL